MIRRTSTSYDIYHRGDSDERLEILDALKALRDMIEEAGLASVNISSDKSDLIVVTIATVDIP